MPEKIPQKRTARRFFEGLSDALFRPPPEYKEPKVVYSDTDTVSFYCAMSNKEATISLRFPDVESHEKFLASKRTQDDIKAAGGAILILIPAERHTGINEVSEKKYSTYKIAKMTGLEPIEVIQVFQKGREILAAKT